MKTSTFIWACALATLALTGCKKEDPGKLIVRMTDAPGDYLQVNVDIREVQVHLESGSGWLPLATNSGVYDLLTLQNDVTTVLAPGTTVPADKVSQLRLILGSNNTLMLADSTVHPMAVPSAEQSGVKINVHATIPSGSPLVITLDYDADRSVVNEGNGSYLMKPVITVDSIY